MSDPILTKPVFFKVDAFAGVYPAPGDVLFLEVLLRPELFDTMFVDFVPTFPDLPSALTHAAWPPSTALATIPAGTVFPTLTGGQADPVNTWEAPADLHLFKISTDTWDNDTWSVGTAKASKRRLTYRTTIQPPSAIPTNDGYYGYDYADPSKYVPLDPVHWGSALHGFAPSPAMCYQQATMFAQSWTYYGRFNPTTPTRYEVVCQNEWLFMLVGTFKPPDDNSVNLMQAGKQGLNNVRYEGELPVTYHVVPDSSPPGWSEFPYNFPNQLYQETYVVAWMSGLPFDGFVTTEPKKPMGNLTTTIGALLLAGLGMMTDGNAPPSRNRKRRNHG